MGQFFKSRKVRVFYLFLTLYLLFVPCSPLFSLDLSTGGGLRISPYFENLNITATGISEAKISNSWVDLGIYAFIDAKYAEFNITYYRALSGSYEQSNFGGPLDLKTEYAIADISYLELSLLGKIPLALSMKNKTNLFAGFAYKICLTSDYGYIVNKGDVKKEFWDQMIIKIGAGIDYPFLNKISVRANFSVGISLPTKEWDNRKKAVEALFADIPGINVIYSGLGCEFSLAIVYAIN